MQAQGIEHNVFLKSRQTGVTMKLKQHAKGRLDRISNQIHALDPDSHAALLSSIIGAMKGAVSFDPTSIAPAIQVLEIVMEDFDGSDSETKRT